MNLADIITVSRIVISPFLYAAGFLQEEVLFASLFAVGAVSDALDGFLARRAKKKSKYGPILDGVADTIFYPSCVFVLVFFPEVRPFAKFILGVFAAQMISMLIAWKRNKGNQPHLISGKVNAVVMSAVVMLLFIIGFHPVLIWILVVSGSISAADRLRMAL